MLSKLIHLQLKVKSFLKREDGATAIEYAIIAGILGLVLIVAMKGLGVGIKDTFKSITDAITGGGTGASN